MATASPELSVSADCCSSITTETSTNLIETTSQLAETVREGLERAQKQLPPWLFYDEAGSLLFEQITALPEYYLTRKERALFEAHAGEMVSAAADGRELRVIELGAGSADKTRTLLAAVTDRQGTVDYAPVDVSATALEAARTRIEAELPGVSVHPQVMDFTRDLLLLPAEQGARQLVLWIGSSVGNFSRADAIEVLSDLRAALGAGDCLLLGLDLAPHMSREPKPETCLKTLAELVAAYDDAQGVTASFNKNMLVRLNRELDADFDLDAFAHRIRWNERESRIEMHLESLEAQTVRIGALGQQFQFAEGETIHTENSRKYRAGEADQMLRSAGFEAQQRWSDPEGWFAVILARAT